MPESMMSDTEEMDGLYGEGSEKEEAKESVDQENEEQMGHTAIVPMKVLQGKTSEPIKEGDEVVLKVVATYGDEAEVEYSTTKPSEIPAGGEEDYGSEIDKMDTESY